MRSSWPIGPARHSAGSQQGLLAWIDRDHSLAIALDAITEPPVTIEPGATVREAVAKISGERVGRLLVSHTPEAVPAGVVLELDLLSVCRRGPSDHWASSALRPSPIPDNRARRSPSPNAPD